ncbi:trifunctional UDP-glucose 4,6-dehydratase/UDP-4-keto-6-deoxy-D-glucose 3,5-epimerase/UDP-4-keto-L-rhamnose-reductase RHM3-like [Glycine soja]|uniref:trifunctional UDP-glucose 4,6-dehydratase/UDP-4-keto-6-deoxy-D-glucose 3,5-epimerase/UDP-4-keto-L-rhamnose-reductase RHM3-like n=1 Tax=Glycine max TaxID=3847 RepID=UPI0007193319|nr:trifunctional UDP-glucose 4,6-dehydratase/UDP-4-keto-6-deoxy-D-glucose 3,5-epimerase/UDP-4-keto-L-rhamnose-reductase RHM3-like [Glycine max]XP_028234154.1 trifunctional UDP-glucose 4,6-dehydratase/UDP-4-keto-6-deoxy-D-glucose 3,5-epimerase/UDP-4-keto-L-rhamnose-reductase RHM3-like [Glycine soja]|eukprot:XP_014631417.1 trifunctional UDP-glucose 4,6-dehydratase/UDP-4-keto-6-deoxy-D-glucose 3,5-epimerase/UDP-4-keto-L-rhamnose-reductase RHM3-like [Glycine max]
MRWQSSRSRIKGPLDIVPLIAFLLDFPPRHKLPKSVREFHPEMSYGLPVITTRGNNVYGPNQFPEKLIPKFILLAMQGKNLPIHGDGSNVRSYLYCEDVAEAFEVVMHKVRLAMFTISGQRRKGELSV